MRRRRAPSRDSSGTEVVLPFRLLIITDWRVSDCVERIAAVTRACEGVAVQHRNPAAADRLFFEQGMRLRDAIGGRAPLFVNRRADVALALGAHLHLTETSIPVEAARALVGSEKLISASWHETTALRAGIDLALLSPVFEKQGEVPLGAEKFERLAASTTTPVFALGGVTKERSSSLQRAAGFAVIGAVMKAPDPVQAARELLAPRG
ncbi:MAG: thiamine phosphate synthase [Archangium sp.]|nr:thiamine phosphate synthase [Archangium sp.]